MPDLVYAKKWLDRAQRDYDFAAKIEKHFWPKDLEQICYHCQQATEKALKAVLAYNEAEILKIHIIGKLVDECKKYGFSVPIDRKVAKLITDHATLSRYPDNMNEWTEEDAKLALKYSKLTLDAVIQYLTESEEQDS
ncbi:MAG: HEPN domain-containing protein [Oscillospiraceae bacterium]|nr:HEPN domain-containing protein [Oscillospiraceae bacterium]